MGLPAGTQLADLMGTKGHRKGGLKSSSTHKAGPCRQLNSLHADRRPLAVSLQVLVDGCCWGGGWKLITLLSSLGQRVLMLC